MRNFWYLASRLSVAAIRKTFVPNMETQFLNRAEAGHLLAEKLRSYANRDDVLVLALPRGGVPVAVEVAKRLDAPLDVFVVRKLGLPGHPELAMGAIASGGVRVFHGAVVNALRIPDEVIDAVSAEELIELQRREKAYRADRPPLDVEGKTVIVIDDGIATGSTMLAAASALRQLNAARIVVAAPVIAASTYSDMQRAADEVVAALVPEHFYAAGQWYKDFEQTSDEEVRDLLAQAGRRQPVEA
jgi:putative phosphoribosyl transferase